MSDITSAAEDECNDEKCVMSANMEIMSANIDSESSTASKKGKTSAPKIQIEIARICAGQRVILCDGTDDAATRIERVLWNDPATGVMRHVDAGYPEAVDCAKEFNLNLPSMK